MAANPFATHHTNSKRDSRGTEIEAVCSGQEWQSSRSAKANMRRVVRLIKPISGSSRYREREKSLIQPWRRLAARGHLLSVTFWQVLAKTFHFVKLLKSSNSCSSNHQRNLSSGFRELMCHLTPKATFSSSAADDQCCTRDAHFRNKLFSSTARQVRRGGEKIETNKSFMNENSFSSSPSYFPVRRFMNR